MAPRNLLEEQRIPRSRCKCTASLPSAVTEWVLILLLLLNGFISYLATKFADFCKLQTPCIFCTRFDHILDSDSPSFFQTLICTSHKHKISSLAYCHTHQKLADVHEMCETCLLSIGNHNKIPSPKIVGIKRKGHCSCCTKSFIMRSQDNRLLIQTKKTMGANVVESDVKLLCLNTPDGFAKRKDPTASAEDSHGHTKQSKLPSDSVPEAPISEEEIGLHDVPPDHSPFGANINFSVIDRENILNSLHNKVGGVHDPAQYSDAKYDVVELGKEEEAACNPYSITIQVPKELSSTKTNLKPTQTCPVHEDLRKLVSEISHGLNYSQHDMISTPRIRQLFREDLKLSRMHSLERNGFCFEPSLDGSKMDDENVVDTLKRYFEFDRKSLFLVYKELEEEQNASAIAANEAMAMITRLQDEKATMQMEALQYQRMMEEQAVYNQEALHSANNIVAEKEKKMQLLELEIVTYRSRFGNDYDIEDTPRAKLSSKGSHKSPTSGCNNFHAVLDITDKTPTILNQKSLLDSEDEKIYIFERLIDIEKKLHPSSFGEDGIENSQLESRHITPEVTVTVTVTVTDNIVHHNNYKHGSTKQTDLSDIENEVNHLHGKLESLESDRCFLEYMIKSLQNGKEGLQFIQEIACHLREIRKIH